MNQGNSVSTGTTTPKTATNWQSVLNVALSLLLSVVGTWHVATSGATGKPDTAPAKESVAAPPAETKTPVAPDIKTSPTPITPAVDPAQQILAKLEALLAGQDAVIQNQLKPVAPVEVPTKPAPAPASAAAITVTQSGKAVTSGTVDAGKLFVVTGSGVTSWASDQDVTTDAGVESTPTGFVGVINRGSILFIGTTSTGIVKQRVSVAVQAIVQPIVSPTPSPSPAPSPVPAGGFDASVYVTALADEAANDTALPANSTNTVNQLLNFAAPSVPSDLKARIRAAVPAIGVQPPRDLTPQEIDVLRGVK